MMTRSSCYESEASDGLAERCRVFYERRLRAAESLDNDISSEANKPVGALGHAMLHLRREMATLMKEDNALLHQLLTLHDAIEELKEQQRALRDTSRSSSLDSLSDTEVADQSASPTSTLSSSSSSSTSSDTAGGPSSVRLPRFFRPVFPSSPHRTIAFPQREVAVPRPLQIVTKDAHGRLVVLRPCTDVSDAHSPYDSGFHGSESDAENNEIFV